MEKYDLKQILFIQWYKWSFQWKEHILHLYGQSNVGKIDILEYSEVVSKQLTN